MSPTSDDKINLMDRANDEAVDWVQKNLYAIRRDDGSLEYTLTAVVCAYKAGHAAALSALTQGGVKVKELEWEEGAPGTYKEVAESPFGHYSVWEINGVACWSPWKQGGGSIVDGGITEAKAAAQQDYDSRILSALSTTLQEPVGEKYKADINNLHEDGWVQVTISGNDAHNLTEQDIEAALNATLAHQPVTAGLERGGAHLTLLEVEKLFPDWKSYRDLIDCIECTLHELRKS